MFYNIYKALRQNHLSFFTLLSIVVVILIYLTTRIQFEEDVSKFVPKSKQNEQLQKVMSSVNFDNKIILKVTSINDSDIDQLIEFANEFIESVENDTVMFDATIQGYIENDDAIKMVEFAYEFAPYLLTEKDYLNLDEKLKQPNIDIQTEKNLNELIAPSGFISKEFILKDPFQISMLALQNLNPSNSEFELKDNFLLTKDHKNLLLFINPNEGTDQQGLVEFLYKTLDDLGSHHQESIRISLFGGPVIAYANASQIKKDIGITLSIASIVLIILFISYYKTLFIPIILIVPTIIGGLMGMSILMLLRHDISAISLGIGSILLGVTFDYSLHIVTHLRNGESVKNIYKNITKPILMSSATTALAFLSIVIIDSQALQDLGIFAASSVLFASLMALILIPQLYKPYKPSIKNSDIDRKPINQQLVDTLGRIPFHQNRPIIIVIVLVLILSVFTYDRVEFNNNLSDLNYFPKSLKTIESELDALVNSKAKSLYIATYDTSLELALIKNDSLYTSLSDANESNAILSINSLRRYLPSQQTQDIQLKRWKHFWTEQKKNYTKENLISSGNTFGFREDAFNDFYHYLDKTFEPITPASYDSINTINLDDYIGFNDNLVVISTMVKVDENNSDAIADNLDGLDNSILIDRKSLNETMLGNLKSEFNTLLLFCVIGVFIFLLFIYRSIKLSLITFLPIIITWLITIGLMGVFGLQFNIFNIIISSFIFGLGVDYSIFITNGLQRMDRTELAGFYTTKSSIILSVITTIVGIGALLFAQHPALKSIALISIIGILSAMFIAFTIQPLLFNLIMKKTIWVK